MKTPLVFSLVRDQSLFMTAIMTLLTFMAVLTLGIALSVGTGVARWNSQWNLYATVQIMSEDDSDAAIQVIDDNRAKLAQVTEIPKADMERMLGPWMSGAKTQLDNYLPKMFEIKFRKKSDIAPVGEQLSQHARFLTHASALKNSTSAGWRMIGISGLILLLTLGAIAVCVSYIARNTALLHRRELEILNQIGAHDSFVAKQMQIIVAKICSIAGLLGFSIALPVMALVLTAARGARVGLMAMMGLNGFGWTLLILMPVAIIIFSIWITNKTTHKILENS
jgi:cell division transport system permease protein